MTSDATGLDEETLHAAQEVSWLLLTLAERFNETFAAHSAAVALSVGQAKVLLQLKPDEAVPMRSLAERTRSDPSNLTGVVDKLEARNLTKRQPGAVDRRVKTLVLTPEGQSVRDELWHRITHDIGPLAHLSFDEIDRMRTLLRAAVYGKSPGPGSA